MKTLRRLDIRHTLYFVTLVTINRKPELLGNIAIFWQSWGKQPLGAWVIIPDHFHAIVRVGNNNISNIIHDFKIRYSIRYRFLTGSGKFWQNRFWDHAIRDERDLKKHLDYIHFNPVKHGISNDPSEYKHSSLFQYLEDGLYPQEWKGDTENIGDDFGE